MNTKDNIFLFAQCVECIIDNGGIEKTENILNECQNGTIVEYLMNQYNNIIFDWTIKIDYKTINDFFKKIGIDSKNNIRKKYFIENNGLCVLVSYALDKIYRNKLNQM